MRSVATMIGWSRNMAVLTHRACDYGHAESQLIKSTVLSDVMPLSKNSVLDVGCGFADYAAFLAALRPCKLHWH